MTLREELQLLLEKHEQFKAVDRIKGITPDTRILVITVTDPNIEVDRVSIQEAVEKACLKSGIPEIPVLCFTGCEVLVL